MSKNGNVFLIIVGIMAIIFTMATFFMQTTIDEKTQTVRSNRAIQAQCMAEIGMELAIGFLTQNVNTLESWQNPHSIGNKIRRPLQKAGNKQVEGLKDNLGRDVLLDTSQISEPFIINKEQLKEFAGQELDEIFKYMGGDDPASDYDLEVTVKIDKAITNLPGPTVDGTNYKVPGIDIEWECHSRVKEFLDNKGYPAIKLHLPEGLTWLEFNIPVKIGDKTIYSFDVLSTLQSIVPKGAIADLLDKTDLHKLLTWLFQGTGLYPYEIILAKNVFPPLNQKIGNIPLPSGPSEDFHVEKNGYLKIESKATIHYPDKKSVTKKILASKEFKCADIEPPCSLYSFFISNLADSKIGFNNIGGDLYVNNFASIGAIKGDPAHPEKREFPGLIRVNGTKRMDVNLSIIGNPLSTGFDEGESWAVKMARGCEWLLMADARFSMKSFEANKGKLNVSISKEFVQKIPTRLPEKLRGIAEKGIEELLESEKPPTPKEEKSKGPLSDLIKVGLNIMPPTKFGIKLWEAPLHFILPGDKSFGKWELPYCGNNWSQFTLPLPFFSTSVTHLFGTAGIFPTMTRDIEGNVAKRYRQWNLGVISYPLGPIPVGNQIPTPWGVMLLPVPLPLWHAHTYCNKYEYNFFTFKTEDSQVKPDQVRVYDPALMQNSPPNLYSIEQYAKKAAYYYETQEDFEKDIGNRLVKVNGKDCFNLDGVTFIRNSIVLPPSNPKFNSTFYVCGRGAIVCGGNVILKGNVEDPYSDAEERNAETPRTVFSLIIRHGGMIIKSDAPQRLRFEGSLYTDKCIAIASGKALKIVGNWVTNSFSKPITRGDILVEYVAYKTRSSLNSVHPLTGKFDPERYHVTFAPTWENWRVQ